MNIGDELYVEPGAPLLHAGVVVGVSGTEGLRAAVASPDHDLFIELFSEDNDDIRHWYKVGPGR
eukprot:3892199-Pyramimonas_sp.AAC.1